MSTFEAAVLVGSSVVSTILGAVLTIYFSRAKPRVFVKSCELSSTLLSRVDYVDLPPKISADFGSFRWKVLAKDESIPDSPSTLPIGIAQENLLYLREFLPCVERTIINVGTLLTSWSEVSAADRAGGLSELLHDNTFVRSLMGKSRRGTFRFFKQDTEEIRGMSPDNADTLLTWSLDDASGVGKGTMGTFSLHVGYARIRFPFAYPDERIRMQLVSCVIATCHTSYVLMILEDILHELKDDRIIASSLEKWFTEALGTASTFVLSVVAANLGRNPVLFSGKADLKILIPGESKSVSISCRSESFTETTEEDVATKRIIEILKLISTLLDVSLPIRKRVLTERTMVNGAESTMLTFRSVDAIKDLPDGQRVLSLFRGARLKAVLCLPYQSGNKNRVIDSKEFLFGSSLPSDSENS